MRFVELPDIGVQKLSYYLAAEEYVARYVEEDPLFFYWQVAPSVICGRNQRIESEVNLEYCKQHDIGVFRRKSGGGCVYADMDNLMLCYISKGDDVQLVYSSFIALVLRALRLIGFDVKASGRNDITIDGKKVSGSAFFHLKDRNIVHSTLLYDTNLDNMLASLTPSSDKLVAKGVESVSSRIAFLKDYTDKSLDEIKLELRKYICGDSKLVLGEECLPEIYKIERTYTEHDFFRGTNKHWTLTRKRRVEGCGDLEVHVTLRGNEISTVEFQGDFFAVGDLKKLQAAMRGQRLERGVLTDVFNKCPPSDFIRGLSGEQLLDILFE